jgi:hypothetical protein
VRSPSKIKVALTADAVARLAIFAPDMCSSAMPMTLRRFAKTHVGRKLPRAQAPSYLP